MNVKLNFELCECGCHGSAAGRGDISYWIRHLPEHRSIFIAHLGHGWISPVIGEFATLEEARLCCNVDAAKELAKLLKALGINDITVSHESDEPWFNADLMRVDETGGRFIDIQAKDVREALIKLEETCVKEGSDHEREFVATIYAGKRPKDLAASRGKQVYHWFDGLDENVPIPGDD